MITSFTNREGHEKIWSDYEMNILHTDPYSNREELQTKGYNITMRLIRSFNITNKENQIQKAKFFEIKTESIWAPLYLLIVYNL